MMKLRGHKEVIKNRHNFLLLSPVWCGNLWLSRKTDCKYFQVRGM